MPEVRGTLRHVFCAPLAYATHETVHNVLAKQVSLDRAQRGPFSNDCRVECPLWREVMLLMMTGTGFHSSISLQRHQQCAYNLTKAALWHEAVPQADKGKIRSQAAGSKHRPNCYPQSWTTAYTPDEMGT